MDNSIYDIDLTTLKPDDITIDEVLNSEHSIAIKFRIRDFHASIGVVGNLKECDLQQFCYECIVDCVDYSIEPI